MMNSKFTRRTPLMVMSLTVLVAVAFALVFALVSLTAQTPSPVAAQGQQPVYVSFDPVVRPDGSELTTVVRSISEDTQFAVDVFLSRPADNDLTLRVHPAAGGPSANFRLTAEVTIMAGAQAGTVMLRTSKDDVQGTRPLRAKLDIEIVSGSGVRHPDARLLTVAPVDDDIVLLDFAQAQPEMVTVAEGETVTLMVELRDHIRTESTDLTVRFEGGLTGERTFDLGATVDEPTRDLTMFPLVFEAPDDLIAGTAPDPITVTLIDDANVRLVDNPKQVVVHVRDSNPVAMVSFVGPTPINVVETETVTLRVELQQDVVATRAIDVLVNLSGGISGERTVTIATGTSFGLLTFRAPADDVPGQAPAAVKADLNLPLAGIGNPVYEVTGTVVVDIVIVDDDAITVGFDRTSYTFTEGEQVSARVEVQGEVADHVNMNVVVTGIPNPGNPGSPQSRNVTLSATNRSATITFPAPDDDQARISPDDVELTIVGTAGVNVAQGAGVATVRFRDNDPVASVGFMGDFRPEVVEGEMVTLEVGLQPGVEASRAIEVRVSGFPSGGPRTVTIPQNDRSASLTFAAPDDDLIGVTPELLLTLEVAGTGDEAQVNPNRDEFRPILYDHEVLAVGEPARGGTLVNFNDSHNWIFEVSGTATQFVILQATGSHPAGSAPARVMGELYAGAVLPNIEGTRRLVAAADDLTRWGASDDERHRYFRIERWLDPGTYALVVEVDGGDRDNPQDRSETYELLADVVMPDANTLTFGQLTLPEALVRANNDPLRGRSVPYYYRLEVPGSVRGTTVTIQSTPSNSNSDPVARLLNGEGGFIAESSKLDDGTAGNMFRLRRVLEPGTYYLAVQSFVDGTSDSTSGSQLGGNVYSLPDPIEFIATDEDRAYVSFDPQVRIDGSERITVVRNIPEDTQFAVDVFLSQPADNDLVLRVHSAAGGLSAQPHRLTAEVTLAAGEVKGTVMLTTAKDDVQGTRPQRAKLDIEIISGNGVRHPDARLLTVAPVDDDIVLLDFAQTQPEMVTVDEGEPVTLTVELRDNIRTAGTDLRVRFEGGLTGERTFDLAEAVDGPIRDLVMFPLVFEAPDDLIAGTAPQPITVTLIDDANVRLVPNPKQVVVHVRDSNPVAMVSFAGNTPLNVVENEMVTLRLQLQDGVEATRAIDVLVNLSGGIGGERTVTIAPGTSFGLLTFRAPADDVPGQAPSQVKADLNIPLLGIGNPVYEVKETAVVDIMIADDDAITVGFDRTSYTFTEGEQVSARVEVQGEVADHVNMNVVVTGIPNPGNLNSPQSRNVTLSATNRSATITFPAPDDDQARVSPDDVELTIVGTAGVNVAQGAGVATVRFRDNDPVASVGFRGDFRPEVVEGEMVTLEVGLQPGVEASRAIEVRVSGFPSGGPRTVTIPQNARSASLTFAAPDDNLIGVTPELRLTLEVASAAGVAQVNPNRDEFRPILHDHEVLMAGAPARGGTLVNFNDSHNWIFEVSGTARQFVILQATGSHPAGSAPARVMGELYAGAVLPNMEGTRRLVAAADDLTRWGTSDDERHRYFRIERWLDPGTYALVVEVDGGDRDNPRDRSETYQLLADIVMPDANTLAFDQATRPEALVRANNDPLRGRSVPYYYRLVVPGQARGTTVTIQGKFSNSDPVARLLNGEGGFIAESSKLNDDTVDNMFKFERILEPGTYYLAVQSFVDGTSDSTSGSQLGGNVYSLPDPIEFAFLAGDPRVARFAPMNPDVAPENREITLTVELSDGLGAAGADLTLNVEYSGGGGYKGPTTVTIPNGATAGTIKLLIPGDTVVGTVPDPLTVTLRRQVGRGAGVDVPPSGSAVTITLTENDPVAMFRLAEDSDRTVVEGNEVTLRVETVDEVPVTETTEVRVELGDGREVVVEFEQGAIFAELKVQTLDNEIAGGRPIDLTVQLVSSSSGAVVAANSEATIRTLDDGDEVATVSFTPRSSDQQVSESGVVTFVAQLNVEATETVVLQIMFSDGRDPQTVMIPAGSRMVEVEVPTISDELEGTPLTVTIESPDGRVMLDADAPGSATVVYVPPVAALLAAEVPVTGGVGLGWGAIAALLAIALAALAGAGALLLTSRRHPRRPVQL